MTLMRYITPTLDNMFMDSLAWVDRTYYQKHEGENPSDLRAQYYPQLKMYDTKGTNSDKNKDPYAALQAFLMRFGKKAAISLGVYLLSLLPYVGRFVLPGASFYTFNKSVGWEPAVVIFGSGIFLPKRYLVMFLQSYFSSRTLMRELVRRPDIFNAIRQSTNTIPSSTPTSPASATPQNKRNSGSTTAPACSTASPSLSSSSSKCLCSACSFTELRKLRRRTSSLRLRTRRLRRRKLRSSRRRMSGGTTSTSSLVCRSTLLIRSMLGLGSVRRDRLRRVGLVLGGSSFHE